MKQRCNRIRHWLFELALPLWCDRGLDLDNGGFHEGLTLDGVPEAGSHKRLRVQARQIYVYSHASVLGWKGPSGGAARHGYEFLTENGWHGDGGWIHVFDASGGVVDGTRDTYDHAFVLLALAWFYRATGDAGALAWIKRTLDFMDSRLADPDHGGFRESVPDALPRRQNPHMHYFEAILALHAATGDDGCLQRAHAVADLLESHFCGGPGGTLREFFKTDWRIADAPAGLIREPGHHYEWTWLLHQFTRVTGRPMARYAERIYEFAETHGVDPQTGLVWDEVYRDGTVARHSSRSWVLTETLKAQLAMREFGGRNTDQRIKQTIDVLFDRFLDVEPAGTWQDQFDARGNPLATRIPASSLYHLFVAFAETLRVLENTPAAQPH